MGGLCEARFCAFGREVETGGGDGNEAGTVMVEKNIDDWYCLTPDFRYTLIWPMYLHVFNS